MKNINIETPSYNQRRYGKPYIAKISFNDSKGEPTWGDWVGYPGDSGLLVLKDIQVGDIIMTGQKDFRNNRKSAPEYFLITSLEHSEKPDIQKMWEEKKAEITDKLHSSHWMKTREPDFSDEWDFNMVAGKLGVVINPPLGNVEATPVTKAEAYKVFNHID